MNEMLANHYYLIKNHQYAGTLFQEVIANEPQNYEAKKKLMVCLLKEGIFHHAWDLYKEIIENKPQVILETTCKIQDCLCLDVLREIRKCTNIHSTNWIQLVELGILYSFKNIKKSLFYFKQALKLSPFKNQIKNLILQIELYEKKRLQFPSTKRKESV